MRRPTRDAIEGLRPISRNLSLDLIAAIGYGVSGALVSTLLPTIARRGGLEPLGLRPAADASATRRRTYLSCERRAP